MSWKEILKNEEEYDKFPKYIRVNGEDYKLGSFRSFRNRHTASYYHVGTEEWLSNLTLEYALKHSIDSEYQKEIQRDSKIDWDADYYQLDDDERD
jgi:hypothetical protein